MCIPHRMGDISNTCPTAQQALQHILQKSSYNYPKRIDMNTLTLLQLGPGILWAEGTRNMHTNGRPRLLSAHFCPCDRVHASAPPEGHESRVQRSATADLHPALPADCSQGTYRSARHGCYHCSHTTLGRSSRSGGPRSRRSRRASCWSTNGWLGAP